MARVVGHLSVEALEARYRAAQDVTEARHFQAIWLLAQGRTVLEVSEVLAFVPRWVTQLAARYNAFGPSALGDRRRRNSGGTGPVSCFYRPSPRPPACPLSRPLRGTPRRRAVMQVAAYARVSTQRQVQAQTTDTESG